MNKLIQILLLLASMTGFSSTFAGTPAANTASNTFNYNSPDDEVAFNIERGKGIVTMNVTMRNMGNYNHVIIEKSVDNPDNFGQCKYITCAEQKNANGKMTETDKYPFAAREGVYYRVKTVSKDGIERCYAPILLPPLENTTNNTPTKTSNKTKTNTNK